MVFVAGVLYYVTLQLPTFLELLWESVGIGLKRLYISQNEKG
jgi:hypothetical protein